MSKSEKRKARKAGQLRDFVRPAGTGSRRTHARNAARRRKADSAWDGLVLRTILSGTQTVGA